MGASTYEASDWVTPANLITIARLLLTPVLLVMILSIGPAYSTLAVGFVIAISDAFDGALARKQGVTRSGAFLDPLADKVLVLGSCFALVAIERFWVVPVLLITARELVISAYRSIWARRSLALPASKGAKIKTLVQEFAVAFALVPEIDEGARWIPALVLWTAVALTLVTGARYLLAGRRAMSETGKGGGQ
ncbi:MAG: CDP-alcohol phosphatidyltransferase family protein [Acidimicrobiales bacterium]